MSADHLSDADLKRMLEGDTLQAAEMEAHLGQCDSCQARLDRVSGADRFTCEFETRLELPDRATLMVLSPSEYPGALGRVGRFEVMEWLATGGTSTVWRAVDPADGRVVALKVLQPLLAAQQDFRARLYREAKSVMSLRHPHILPVLELDDLHDPPFLVMAFMDGGTLQERMENHVLPADEVRRIGMALAAALAAAHEAGVIHRDLKPSNVLLSSSGEVMLADFGIARALEGATLMTQTGSFLGTPRFMSPEQAAGSKELDARTDLFSLGAVLYVMSTGRQPFSGISFQELSRSVQEDAPASSPQMQPELPAWLENLILHLLAKRPKDRPSSAAEVLGILREKRDLGRMDRLLLTGGSNRQRQLARRMLHTAAGLLALFTIALMWSERSGRTSWINHLLCAASGESYYIVGRWGTFGLLDKAIEAAGNGDVVEVRTNDPATGRGGLRIPPGKALTLRAAAGFTPTLPLQAAGFPSLAVVDSPLVMEGFVFLHTSRALKLGRLIHMRGASLKMINCRFVRQPRPPDALQGTLHALISVTDCPSIEMIDCELYAPGSPLVGIIANGPMVTKLAFTRCHLWGTPVWCDDRPPVQMDIQITQCEVFAGDMLHFHQALPDKSLTMKAANNIIQAYGSVIHCPWPQARLDAVLRWSGETNRYFLPGQFVLAQDGRIQELAGETGSTHERKLAMPFNQKDFSVAIDPAQQLQITLPKR